jgi:hypothetical protein
MKRIAAALSLVFFLTPGIASAAITIDTSAKGTASTLSYTVGAGTGPLLMVAVTTSGSTNASGVTYNGIAMTNLCTINSGGTNPNMTLWALATPTQGSSQTISVSGGPSIDFVLAESFLGTGGRPTNVSCSNSPVADTQFTASLTTQTANAWTGLIAGTGGLAASFSSNNQTIRQSGNGGTWNSATLDSNASVGGVGTSYSTTFSWTSSQRYNYMLYEIPTPAAAAAPRVSAALLQPIWIID